MRKLKSIIKNSRIFGHFVFAIIGSFTMAYSFLFIIDAFPDVSFLLGLIFLSSCYIMYANIVAINSIKEIKEKEKENERNNQ